jgi:uncharacterized membrane protein YheB (UPF0754 family)
MDSSVYILVLIPIVSALIGWITNYLAVKMIFRPRRPVHILGFEIMGLIPKRKSDLARKIGETVETELLSHKDIHAAVSTEGFHNHLLDVIMGKIDQLLAKVMGGNPLVAMMLSGEAAGGIRQMLREELGKVLPGVLEELFEKMEEKINFKDIVREKVESFDLSKLESIIYAIAAKELKAIEILGGVLGFVVGLAQVGLLLLAR